MVGVDGWTRLCAWECSLPSELRVSSYPGHLQLAVLWCEVQNAQQNQARPSRSEPADPGPIHVLQPQTEERTTPSPDRSSAEDQPSIVGSLIWHGLPA